MQSAREILVGWSMASWSWLLFSNADSLNMEHSLQPELKVQMELDQHEKECAIRYETVNDKLEQLDKRLWRLEAMVMFSTLSIIALVVSITLK